MEDTKTLICQKCGKPFEVGKRPLSPEGYSRGYYYRKYCDDCLKPPEYKIKVCKYCGKEFKSYRREDGHYSDIYCEDCKKLGYQNKAGSVREYSDDFSLLKQVCKRCGKVFWVGKSDKGNFFLARDYCDDCIKIIDNKKVVESICVNCGKVITANYKRKYCDDCLKPKETKTLICQKCGRPFEVGRKLSNGKFSGYKFRKYCDDCLKPATIEKTCPVCGVTFITLKSQPKKYCGNPDCISKGQTKTLKETTNNNWGIDYPTLLPQCRCQGSSSNSKVNQKFYSFLISLGIDKKDVVAEFNIDNYYYDFLIKNKNIILELNPTYTHSTIQTTYKAITKNYHRDKTKLALEHGYRCINIWDWDDWNKIAYQLLDKIKLFARKLDMRDVNKKEADSFLNKYHIQNSCYGNLVNIGLFLNDELVQVMTFGRPRYNKNYEWELLRLCTHPKYFIVGGTKRLFKCFIDSNKPESIISYCDLSKFNGNVYSDLGFRKIDNRTPQPREHWCNYRNHQHITASLLLQKGYDNIFGTDYGKGTDNRELMLQNNWLPIYDCGQQAYIITFSD